MMVETVVDKSTTSLDAPTTTTSIQLDRLGSAEGHPQEKLESLVALRPVDDIPDGGLRAWGAVFGGCVSFANPSI